MRELVRLHVELSVSETHLLDLDLERDGVRRPVDLCLEELVEQASLERLGAVRWTCAPRCEQRPPIAFVKQLERVNRCLWTLHDVLEDPHEVTHHPPDGRVVEQVETIV